MSAHVLIVGGSGFVGKALVKALLEKEVLHKSDVERLIGPRPYANEERIKMNGHTAEPTAPIGDHGDIVPNP